MTDPIATSVEMTNGNVGQTQSTMLRLNIEDPQSDAKDEIPYRHSLHETLKTIAGISGNVLEWYDFAVFGFFGDISK